MFKRKILAKRAAERYEDAFQRWRSAALEVNAAKDWIAVGVIGITGIFVGAGAGSTIFALLQHPHYGVIGSLIGLALGPLAAFLLSMKIGKTVRPLEAVEAEAKAELDLASSDIWLPLSYTKSVPKRP